MIRDLDDKGLEFLFVTSFLSPLSYCLFFVASSLSPHLACFLARLGALRSASCQSPSFPLQRFGGPDYRSSYLWCGVDGKRSYYRLVKMVPVERADELFEVLDC